MKRRPRVALIIETSNEYARGLLHGIRTYILEHDPWSIDMGELRRGEPALEWLKDWQGDGIIARIETKRIAQIVLKAKRPTVDMSAARFAPQFPMVETDDRAIAQAAFDHLLQRGLRRFAFCGDPSFQWSNWRAEHFERLVREHGFECHVFPRTQRDQQAHTWRQQLAAIGRWLKSIEKPVGVMACYDYRGRQVLEACRRGGMSVPDEVAVVGVDNDELLCDLADPPLSSVAPDTDRTGYVAAELLDRMMAGEDVPPDAHLIKPVGVVSRRSTDVLSINDERVAAAMRFIRMHATEGIKVEDVVGHVGISRRSLDRRFALEVGHTPHEQITLTQADHAKRLLMDTDLSLAEVAHRCGYSHVEYMSVVLKKRTGLPPSEYRRQHQTRRP